LAALEGEEIREAKRTLAYEATTLTHGEAEAKAAEEAARAAFAGDGDIEAMPATSLPSTRLKQGVGVLEIFTEVGLTRSNSEARRMVQQGGVYVNDRRIDQADAVLTSADLGEQGILLRAGKKKYHRLVVED
jgi:tyrosyl-tRNA synthetase